jgi:hypothetical protein
MAGNVDGAAECCFVTIFQTEKSSLRRSGIIIGPTKVKGEVFFHIGGRDVRSHTTDEKLESYKVTADISSTEPLGGDFLHFKKGNRKWSVIHVRKAS